MRRLERILFHAKVVLEFWPNVLSKNLLRCLVFFIFVFAARKITRDRHRTRHLREDNVGCRWTEWQMMETDFMTDIIKELLFTRSPMLQAP